MIPFIAAFILVPVRAPVWEYPRERRPSANRIAFERNLDDAGTICLRCVPGVRAFSGTLGLTRIKDRDNSKILCVFWSRRF